MEISEFQPILYGLGELYDKELTPNLVNIYYEIFKDFSIERFKKAIGEVIKSHKYANLPKPAEILEYLEGTREDNALIAWLKVRGAIENVGYYESVEFDDPVISHCLFQMGGWMKVCEVLNKDLPFMEKDFMELYRLYAKRGITQPIKLSGFFEVDNLAKGFYSNIPEPIKIGWKNNGLLIDQRKSTALVVG
jgi:hypothetical protein